MKIAVVGAGSPLGRKIVLKAEDQGINVVSIVKDASVMVGTGPVIIKDFSEIDTDDFEGCHYVIDAESFTEITRYSSDLLPLWRLLEVLKNSASKLLCIGSCAFLYTDKSRNKMVLDDSLMCYEDAQSKREQRLCVNAYKRLKENSSVSWSVLCPPLIVDKRGYGSGSFEFLDDVLPMDIEGRSVITLNDLASAVVELLKIGPKEHKCASVYSTPRK